MRARHRKSAKVCKEGETSRSCKIPVETTVVLENRRRGEKAPSYYRVTPRISGGAWGIELENKLTITPNGSGILSFMNGDRGFPDWPETPRFVFDKKKGPMPRDIEMYGDYWLVSVRAKYVLEYTARDGVLFARCDTRFSDGEETGEYWLCEVTRVLDAVDEERSRIRIDYIGNNKKIYDLMGGASIHFRREVIGGAHIFRMAFMESCIIGDNSLKKRCFEANLNGFQFSDMSKY